MSSITELRIIPVDGLGEIAAGDDIGTQIVDAALAQGTRVMPGDVVVVAQKIVSKAEGRVIPASTREDARAAALREARRVVRETADHLIVETQQGLVCANAGVDMSNVSEGTASLLPRDPDASAQRIRRTIEQRCGSPVAVIVSDTFGRAWRIGHTNVAIGSSGLQALRTYEGKLDPAGRELLITQIAHIDELASAAELVMDKLDRIPACIVRGYEWAASDGSASDLVRPVSEDLFR
ncbi:MAG TPA: coenzyme F420-0:L-glutamate ligase [Actinomycetota bacterium]|jgi:coenzyme F420-0:L-glutamate ligase/coenzyme F420-1:gamma-L-glutamate ligase|nr:coenzyme F420-0:L-glutamate ligase [Actinomycetota bacterium]